MEILGTIMCVVGIINIFAAIGFFVCTVADEGLKYLITGIVMIITGLILICDGCRSDSYVRRIMVDIMSDINYHYGRR